MRFSRSLKSSAHSLPSPDGAYIATALPSKLTIRGTRSLEITRVITLPADFTSNIQWFLWSASSRRLLLSAGDSIRVFSTTNQQFNGTITNPTSGTAKITAVAFGATDDEICVFSDFGLKLTIFNLSTSTSVDITSPKLYHPGNWSKGFAYRPRTQNLALLTRNGGKDVISIHTTITHEVMRSWNPDTVDAQTLSWSPDGRWLALVESAGQGHRILVYTADGHLYKVWNGPLPTIDDKDIAMGAGVKMLEWNATGEYLAMADYSSKVTILSTPWFSGTMSLNHTTVIKPVTGLHIWQEQVTPAQSSGFERAYTQSTQTTCPPTLGVSPAANDSNTKTGVNILSFDASGTLIATRCESMPTAIWIWDIATKVLKAVLIQHAPVAKVTWHADIPELLMIRCEGDDSRGLAHFWEPTWDSPKIVDFGTQVPDGKIIGRSVARWLRFNTSTPAVFFSDTQDCILSVLGGGEDEDLPWQDAVARGVDIYGEQEESPLNLVAADEKRVWRRDTMDALMNEPTMTRMSGDSDEVDDTFRFRKFMEP